jgi:hypothetical protein
MAYVWITHPDLPDSPPAEVPEAAFEAHWRYRGWGLTDPPGDPAEEAPESPKPAEVGGLSAAKALPKSKE